MRLNVILHLAAVLRILDISQFVINVALFDRLNEPEPSNEKQEVQDVTRSLVLLVWNYIELVIWFGLVYMTLPFKQGSFSIWSHFYFSAMTQLTVGYGDITPLKWTKAVAILQGTLGWVVTVIVISRFVSALPSLADHSSKDV